MPEILDFEVRKGLIEKALELQGSDAFREDVRKDIDAVKEFVKLFPFRDKPGEIDNLTPQRIFNPGRSKDYFFYYFEHKLKKVGAIMIKSSKAWINARENLDLFKDLLKLIVDDSITIHKKIDDNRWSKIKGWGGDKHYVKKLLFIYYHDTIIPTFKTQMLEARIRALGLGQGAEKEARALFNKPLQSLSVGEKFELYNGLLLDAVKRVLSEGSKIDVEFWLNNDGNTCAIARLLGEYVPRQQPIRGKGFAPLSEIALLYEPVNELGVVLLFGMYHRELGFPYIIKVQRDFPDIIALDEDGNYCRIEIEFRASSFIQHNHNPEDCDYIICWEDDLEEGNPLRDKVISLKDEIISSGEEETTEDIED